MTIPYIDHEEFLVGKDHPSATDTLNRPLRDVITKSGLNPDAAFPGFTIYPSVADTAARDVAFPAPLVNQRIENRATGYIERFDGAQWLPEGVTRSAGPIVSARAKGAKGTGAVDDRAALALADGAAPAAGRCELDPGTYRVDANIALNAHWRPARGALFKPNAGVTITFNSVFDPGLYRCIDFSLGGTVAFTYMRQLAGEWFVFGDGATSDTANLNALSLLAPDYSRVVFSTRLRIALTDSWVTDGKRAIEWIGLPTIPDGQGVELLWHGPYGGKMVYWNHMYRCTLKGFTFRPADGAIVGVGGSMANGSPILTEPGFQQFTAGMVGKKALVFDATGALVLTTTVLSFQNAGQVTLNANAPSALDTVRYIIGQSVTSGPAAVDVDWDLVGAGITATECYFLDNHFVQNCALKGHVHLRMSNVSTANVEHGRIFRNAFLGGGTSPFIFDITENGASVSTTAGDTLVTINGGGNLTALIPNAQFFIGQRVQIVSAGGAGVAYDGIIKSVISGTQFRVRTNIPASVVNQRCLLGEGNGIGIQNGASSNALGHYAEDNLFVALEKGIYIQGGSISTHRNSFEQCGMNRHVESSSVPCLFYLDDSEQARQDTVTGLKGVAKGVGVVRIIGNRTSPLHVKPHSGFFEFNAGQTIIADGVVLPEAIRADAKAWDLHDAQNVVTIRGTHYGFGITMALAGYNDLHADVMLTSDGEAFISDAPGNYFRKFGAVIASAWQTCIINGFPAFAAPNAATPDAQILNAQASPFTHVLGGMKSRLGFRFRDETGNIGSIFPGSEEAIDLVDGANVPVDASLGNYFALQIGGAARTIQQPTNPRKGQRITFQFWNNTAGAVAIAFAGAYKIPAGVVNPAAGKVCTVSFTYYPVFGQWIMTGNVSPDL